MCFYSVGPARQNVFSEDERGGATTDDEMHSDSESSVTSITDRKKSFEQVIIKYLLIIFSLYIIRSAIIIDISILFFHVLK